LICTILEVTNNFPFTLQDSTISRLVLFIAKVLLDLLVLLVSTPPTVVPSWNHHIDKYVYEIFGFTNKYMENNGTILIFHDDNPRMLKDIKSFLDTNGYEIHFRWAIINSLLRMSNGIKGKMVIPLWKYIYIAYYSIESYWTNSYHSLSCRPN
jgi:hypothetical protein